MVESDGWARSRRSWCDESVGDSIALMFDKLSSAGEANIDLGRSLDRGAAFSCNMDGVMSLSDSLMVSIG